MRLGRLRVGELLACLGAACVIASLLAPWYQTPSGQLDAFDTFGPAVVLLVAAAFAALWLAVATATERSVALPVAAEVWCVLLGLLGVVSAVVRLLERPQNASGLCSGAWLSFAGALLIFAGACIAMRDERTAIYDPAEPEPRPRPRP